MGEQKWQFDKIENSLNELKKEAAAVKADLEEERAEIAAFDDIWVGNAKEAWQAEQQQWNEKAAKVNETLDQLVAVASSATGEMKSAETDVAGMFH